MTKLTSGFSKRQVSDRLILSFLKKCEQLCEGVISQVKCKDLTLSRALC